MRMLRRQPLLLLCVLVAARAEATSGPTIYENSQTYPLGSRAAGMGGAYTALACDEAALHYNPAALGCASASRLELAANAYMLQHFDAPDAFGPSQDITATSYHPLPSIAGFVRLLADGDASGVGRIGLGLSVSVPHSLFLAVEPPNPEKKDFFSITLRDDLLAGDLGVGWQLSPELALGASVGGVMRTFQSKTSLLLVGGTPKDCAGGQCFDFVAADSSADLLAIGLRAKVGARWRPLPMLTLGAMVVTPTLDVYGTSTLNNSTTVAIAGFDPATNRTVAAYAAVPERATGSSELSLPARISVGAALALSGVLLSLDLSLGLPATARVAHDMSAVKIEGVAPPTEAIPDTKVEIDLRPNLNLGVEVPLGAHLVLDAGAFTDLSSTSRAQLDADQADRVHMFGFTAAFGLLGRQARSWFGASFEIGSGTTRIRSQALSFEEVAAGATDTQESSYTRWNLVGILGSSYSFIDDAALPPESAER